MMAPKLTESAQELIERLDNEAVPYMKARIERFERERTPRSLNQAYRLLSEVEKLLKEET
jgi:hypothetical protein